jgi:hypothetical protein
VSIFLPSLLLFIRASSLLRRFDRGLGIGRACLLLELFGLSIILWISSQIDSRTFTSWILTFLSLFSGASLLFISGIGFSIMFMRLGEIDGLGEGFRLAGIIYMAGAFFGLTIPIAGHVTDSLSMTLMYFYSHRSLRLAY